jgi:hypothetical protein
VAQVRDQCGTVINSIINFWFIKGAECDYQLLKKDAAPKTYAET